MDRSTADGPASTGTASHQNSTRRPNRQPLNPVVVELTKAGLRAEMDGYPGLAEMHFDFAQALAGLP